MATPRVFALCMLMFAPGAAWPTLRSRGGRRLRLYSSPEDTEAVLEQVKRPNIFKPRRFPPVCADHNLPHLV
eukprot:scaffold476_cov191-Pinguiococcus_pyrenoidosus.AAC.1